MIGSTICGINRPSVGNLSGGPTIISLKSSCVHWRRSAMRSPITSKTMRRVARYQSFHEGGRELRRPYSSASTKRPRRGGTHDGDAFFEIGMGGNLPGSEDAPA